MFVCFCSIGSIFSTRGFRVSRLSCILIGLGVGRIDVAFFEVAMNPVRLGLHDVMSTASPRRIGLRPTTSDLFRGDVFQMATSCASIKWALG